MKKITIILCLGLMAFVACKKDNADPTPSDPADKFVKKYTIKETMVQTFGGTSTNSETFNGEIVKVDESQVEFKDYRTVKPVYTLEGWQLTVNGEKLSHGAVNGVRYGNDSLVMNWLFGTMTAVYKVKWVCK